jgi:beta-carotene 3-hydroxylase
MLLAVISNIAVFIVTFFGMEWVGWLTHRYIMHGPLWFLHADHHDPKYEHPLQKNDLFIILFSLPGILLIYFGVQSGLDSPLLWAGIGVSVYGVAYFFVHEGVIHRRIRTIPTAHHPYFVALRRAHGAHHGSRDRTGGVCFGMLCVPLRYFRDAWANTPQPKSHS